jgi:hypothetical protein
VLSSSCRRVERDLRRHSGVGGTLPLTEAPVPADPPRRGQLPGTAPRVHGDGLADDEAIGDELADGLAGVGVGDLVDLVGVEPDLALAAVGHGCREALLRAEVHPAAAGHISTAALAGGWACTGAWPRRVGVGA